MEKRMAPANFVFNLYPFEFYHHANVLKEYYKIVNEARPLLGFISHRC